MGDVLDEARAAISAGAAEIQLCAQDAAAYGADSGRALPELVGAVAGLPGEFMVRVGMMSPTTARAVFAELLESYESPKVFKFLHLPVQSGDDGMLAAMGRGYAASEAIGMIAAFRSRFPESTIATDVIVGFPGEGSAAHEATVRFIEAARPDIVNVTRFSPRPGTAAAAMGGIPHGRATKARSRELTTVRKRLAAMNSRAFVGTQTSVFATERGRRGTTLARTRGYRQVVIRGDMRLGKWYDVTIFKSTHINLFGETVKIVQNVSETP
jgi:MiaB/RimO family radical SAM methylthiotransferase